MLNSDKQFRNALGRFATGVCVICSLNDERLPMAMTINSFSSVSLDPSLILWSLKKNSLSHELFANSHEYSVSVLSKEQLALSNRYAKAGNHLMHAGDYLISSRGIPFVRNSLTHFQCENWQMLEAGDHDVLLAKVLEYSCNDLGEPLVFWGGGYRSLSAAH